MTDPAEIDTKVHERNVAIIASATARLLEQFGPRGFTPQAIFEGAVKGGTVALVVGTGLSMDDTAALLEEIAGALRQSAPGAAQAETMQ